MFIDWLANPPGLSEQQQLDERIRLLNAYRFCGKYVHPTTLYCVIRGGLDERQAGKHAGNWRYGLFLQHAKAIDALYLFGFWQHTAEEVARPSVWRKWMAHDWAWLKLAAWRILTRLNGLEAV